MFNEIYANFQHVGQKQFEGAGESVEAGQRSQTWDANAFSHGPDPAPSWIIRNSTKPPLAYRLPKIPRVVLTAILILDKKGIWSIMIAQGDGSLTTLGEFLHPAWQLQASLSTSTEALEADISMDLLQA